MSSATHDGTKAIRMDPHGVCLRVTGFVAAARKSESPSAPLAEPFDSYNAKELRKEVSRLKLKVVRKGPDANAHKQGYMALLRAHYQNCGAESNATRSATMRTETQAKTDDIVIRYASLGVLSVCEI